MPNIIAYKEQAREELKQGVKMLADIVGSTLGAAGRGVAIDNVISDPFVTADGVTVAMNVDIEATFPQIGISLLKNVAMNTNNVVGDGTSTSIVLANAMLNNDSLVEKRSPSLVKAGMDRAVNDIKEFLNKKANKIEDEKSLVNIATISARGDREMGEIIAQAYSHSGVDGQIMVEDGRSKESKVQYITGYSLDAGFYHEISINNEKRKLVEYEEPLIYITDFNIYEVKDILDVLTYAANEGKPLVLIGNDISDGVMKVLVSNIVTNKLTCTYINAPEVGERQTAILRDLAFYTGGKARSSYYGDKPSDFNPEMLGTCKRFVCNNKDSVFLSEDVDKDAIQQYEKDLPEAVEDADFHKKRLSRLRGRISKISVGATTSVEMREKRDRVEDAVNATKAALEEGYVAGGGVALTQASKFLSKKIAKIKNEDERAGYELVIKSIVAPNKKILHNLYDDNEKVEEVHKNLYNSNYPRGFDVKTQKYVNMYKAGIIDPVKVTKTALESSVSVISTILNTNGIIAVVGDRGKLQL